MGSKPSWVTIHSWRKARERGTEDATGTKEHPGRVLLERATAGRNTRLQHYLETGSSAQRSEEELNLLLTGLASARAARERWLRGVLDACED